MSRHEGVHLGHLPQNAQVHVAIVGVAIEDSQLRTRQAIGALQVRGIDLPALARSEHFVARHLHEKVHGAPRLPRAQQA